MIKKYKISRKLWHLCLVIIMIAGFTMAIANPMVISAGSDSGKEIFINQVGYLPDMPKWVAVTREAKEFSIIDEKNNDIVVRGPLKSVIDLTSKEKIWRGEFTNLKAPGTYRVMIPKIGRSYPFIVGNDIYNKVFELGTRFYYFQRCGIDFQDQETGLKHSLCHNNDGHIARQDEFYKVDDLLSSKGGWHDAGDYGKYVTTTTVTVAQMMLAFELWPEKFTDGQLQIPENGNQFPDLLDEAKYGLEWLFTMQRPDGAVYHKIAGQSWAGFESPEWDTQKRLVYGISTADTGKFAATMAISARVLREKEPLLAERCRKAAFKAWDFLSAHSYIWDHNVKDDLGSGAYGIENDKADRLWAALELSTLSEPDETVAKTITQLDEYQPKSVGWYDSTVIGLFDYARSPIAQTELKEKAVSKIMVIAKQYLASAQKSGFRYTLRFEEFAWASNKEALARGAVMLMADFFKPNLEFRQFALAQLDFVLGFNPLSKCFVSGLGTNMVIDPHHRFVANTGKIIPGLMAGGPNNWAESKAEPAGKGPFSYADIQLSYSSNEPAIDYNAALVFIAAAFAKTL